MLKINVSKPDELDRSYRGMLDQILGFEQAALPACPSCAGTDIANVQVGIIGRTITIAAGTTKFKLIPNGPKRGNYFRNACGVWFSGKRP